jgi:hypothetical protein
MITGFYRFGKGLFILDRDFRGHTPIARVKANLADLTAIRIILQCRKDKIENRPATGTMHSLISALRADHDFRTRILRLRQHPLTDVCGSVNAKSLGSLDRLSHAIQPPVVAATAEADAFEFQHRLLVHNPTCDPAFPQVGPSCPGRLHPDEPSSACRNPWRSRRVSLRPGPCADPQELAEFCPDDLFSDRRPPASSAHAPCSSAACSASSCREAGAFAPCPSP